MKSKKLLICVASAIAFISLLSFYAPPPNSPTDPDAAPEFDQDDYEQNTPIALQHWVQKLSEPLEDGRNMIMRIKYADTTLPDSINIYYGDGQAYTTFRDKGTFPDINANDGIYSAYLIENIGQLEDRILAAETAIENRGYYVKFTGHTGEMIEAGESFDFEAFNSGEEVELSAAKINAADCDDDLLRERSLFITHINVVEDKARTYNPSDNNPITAGNPIGEWTFGYLMEGAANWTTTYNPQAAPALMKSWVKHWMTNFDDQQGNSPKLYGQIVKARPEVFQYLIFPWLKRCDPTINTVNGPVLDASTWETVWDNTAALTENIALPGGGYKTISLITKYAPFKLTAIINRLDLRGNTAYSTNLSNAGETRFIFTLMPPVNNGAGISAGNIPYVTNQGLGSGVGQVGLLDWEGMNVILEYGNIQVNRCQLRDFAQQWLDLSDPALAFGTTGSAYNDALANITATVTTAHNGGAGKPNSSALNRIRTNERIFLAPAQFGWRDVDWEMRQFEIDATSHLFKQVQLTNTPLFSTNYAHNLTPTTNGPNFQGTTGDELLDVIFSSPIRQMQLEKGTHNFPASYNNSPFLAAVATFEGEGKHYWGMDFSTSQATYYNPNNYPSSRTAGVANKYDVFRQQMSLNTCQGCHAGETKTVFTHVMPVKYGDDVDYVGTTPKVDHRNVDSRDYSNYGQNNVNSSVQPNYEHTTSTLYYQKVSAFLTGRNFTGTGTSGFFKDDYSGDFDDNLMDGLYFVADPSNSAVQPPYPNFNNPPVDLKWGYNDLLRRKNDLCLFVNQPCLPELGTEIDVSDAPISIGIEIAIGTSQLAFPVGSH